MRAAFCSGSETRSLHTQAASGCRAALKRTPAPFRCCNVEWVLEVLIYRPPTASAHGRRATPLYLLYLPTPHLTPARHPPPTLSPLAPSKRTPHCTARALWLPAANSIPHKHSVNSPHFKMHARSILRSKRMRERWPGAPHGVAAAQGGRACSAAG